MFGTGKLPENVVPVALFPIGYPAKDAIKNPMYTKAPDRRNSILQWLSQMGGERN